MNARECPVDNRITCVVVDPHPALAGLVSARLADEGFDVVAQVTSADAGVEAVEKHRPKLVVCDPDLAASDGRAVLDALRSAAPEESCIVAFADATELGSAGNAILAGVDAIVAKQSTLDELVRVVSKAVSGGCHVGRAFCASPADPVLTTRERLTLRLLADGLGYREIAERLGVAPETVRVHAATARKRLGATTRTQAVATALRSKLIK